MTFFILYLPLIIGIALCGSMSICTKKLAATKNNDASKNQGLKDKGMRNNKENIIQTPYIFVLKTRKSEIAKNTVNA